MIAPTAPSDPILPERRRTPLAELQAELAHACPTLSDDGEERRAAVLLLMLTETGPNVDRLALRTRFPREFVSRCVRRLADNALWVDGELRCDWPLDRALSPSFWRDVDVALGRQLRRVNADGETEWAPAAGWVKDFEYAGRNAQHESVSNVYRHIPAHDPEPVPPSAEEEEEEVAPEPTLAPERPRFIAPLVGVKRPPEPARWLGETPAVPAPRPAPGVAAVPLGEGWSTADWLT